MHLMKDLSFEDQFHWFNLFRQCLRLYGNRFNLKSWLHLLSFNRMQSVIDLFSHIFLSSEVVVDVFYVKILLQLLAFNGMQSLTDLFSHIFLPSDLLYWFHVKTLIIFFYSSLHLLINLFLHDDQYFFGQERDGWVWLSRSLFNSFHLILNFSHLFLKWSELLLLLFTIFLFLFSLLASFLLSFPKCFN